MAGNKTISQRLKEIQNEHFNPASLELINGTLPPSGVATHNGVDLEVYDRKSVLIRTSGSCNVYFQASQDGEDWYELIATDGGTAGFDEKVVVAIDTAAYWIAINQICKYFRVVVDSQAAENMEVKVTLFAK